MAWAHNLKMDPLPASYYGPLDEKNPVLSAFQSDLKEFKAHVKKILGSPNDHRSYSRGSMKLYETWNMYKPRLPSAYFEEHLLKTADFLFESKLYSLALWQGYRLYLQQFPTLSLESIKDVEHFKQSFFSDGFNTEKATLTLRALQGECQCIFYLERVKGEVPDRNGLQRMLNILGFLRILTQAILPVESLCLILYNGSLYMYNICRFLMSVGHVSEILEYLLWACISVETSIPLLNAKFLPLRVTLYCAVCECYFYEKNAVQAEVFARRALGKISQVAELKKKAGLPVSFESQQGHREAAIKLGVMIYKHAVYKHRRKPEVLWYRSTKSAPKDRSKQQIQWHRTATGRILMEMFEGNAAQFLAVVEALHDSSARLLQTGMPEESEVQKVVLELISAGISFLSGFDSESVYDASLPSSVNAITSSSTLWEMALAGKSQISVDDAVRFIKQLFRYEQWSMFDSLSSDLLSALHTMESRLYRKYELELMLLKSVACLISTHSVKFLNKDAAVGGQAASMPEEFLHLIQTLHLCVCSAPKDMCPDAELVVDIVLFYWAKCKTVFQRAQTGHGDPVIYLGKMENHEQWVETLLLLCEVTLEHRLAEVDFISVTDMTLRLATVLESIADTPLQSGRKTSPKVTTKNGSEESTPVGKPASSFFMRSRAEQLKTALDIVERGVECVSSCRTRSLNGGFAVYDQVFMQKFSDTKSFMCGRDAEDSSTPDHTILSMDLHLELLTFQHRLFLKLCDCPPDEGSLVRGAKSKQNRPTEESLMLKKFKKNKISKCVFLAQKALLNFEKDQTNRETKKILEEAITLIEKAELEEKELASSFSPVKSDVTAVKKKQPPPAPILVSRSNHSMTFKPAPYTHEDEVYCYCIYGKEAEGVNLKVRLRDCNLCGTGDMILARGECLLHVRGLETNQMYIFAVAAFDAEGRMMANVIGETTRPLLASLPLPLLTTKAHLAQVCYETGLHTFAKRACGELWSHFTVPSSSASEVSKTEQEGLVKTRLNLATMQLASPVLHQFFLYTIFIQTDINIQKDILYCDKLCDNGPFICSQEARLTECEPMLVAIDIALAINDSSSTLQAVLNCYSLLAPIIYHQIHSEPITEVLLKCFSALLEIPELLKQKHPAATRKSLQHMVVTMTYYLVKSLNLTQQTSIASSVKEQGKKLLQEITEGSQQPPKTASSVQRYRKEAHEEEHLKALNDIVMKMECMQVRDRDDTSCNKTGHILTGQEDPAVLYTVIKNNPLQNAFQEVMKFKQRSCFLEFVACLLQKALQEDQLELVFQWEQSILDWFSQRNEAQLGLKMHPSQEGGEFTEFATTAIEYSTNKVNIARVNKRSRQKKLLRLLKSGNSERESKAVNILLNKLPAFIKRHQHGWRLKKISSEDSLWYCHINLSLACAYLGLLRRNMGPPPQLCFSHLPWSFFSLAHCGTLVMWKNVPQHIKSPELPLPKAVSPLGQSVNPGDVKQVKDITHGAPNTSEKDPQNPETSDQFSSDGLPASQTASQLLEMLNKASIHLRRAMVLAHRWGHWTNLQWACRTLWDQSNTLVLMMEQAQSADTQSRQLTLEQIYTVITPLLVLASDLLMDMMEKLKLWNVYDKEEEELEVSLFFCNPMDDGTVVDLRWLKTLVLHTLELLHYQAKWENLAHLALLFNTYTRERYSHIVTPVLVHAQRRLLDRIRCFEGPPAPQPYFTYTEKITGEKVTCRTYARKQLLLPRGEDQKTKNDSHSKVNELAGTDCKKDMKRAMCLVCVPLDVEDTLQCFRESQERRQHALKTFQNSRTLLYLLLADTQHSFVEVPFSKEPSDVLQGSEEFSLAASTSPGISPIDPSAEENSSLDSIYSTTLPPSQIHTVISSYNSAIKYLQANKCHSLQVQALHDLGNLYFYKGNRKDALSNWSKALDCALQSSGVLESWNGDSWGSNTSQETLRHVGIWSCLQGALLSAKIAQHILTSNIDQRISCCLLSAKLFKCLLMASMPHPKTDLAYATYSVETELIPGVDLFSGPDQGNIGGTVASLSFLCLRLYKSGHFLKALPMLALYLYIVKTLCRDSHLTVTCRILKVKVLTELRIFNQAVKELNSLTCGKEIPRTHGGYHRTGESSWATKQFLDEKPLLDPSNLQVLEDVVNRSPSRDITALYGPSLTKRLLMARVQLILAICSTVHNLPEPLTPDPSEISETKKESDKEMIQKPNGLQLTAERDRLTLGKLKAILLNEAHDLISPEIIAPHQPSTDAEELELAVEIKLLMSNINQQQGRMADSADMAMSALSLIQSSRVFQRDFCPSPPPKPLSFDLKRSRYKAKHRKIVGFKELNTKT